jgi:phage-related protein
MKPAVFLGNSLAHLRRFPNPARRELGYQLEQVQQGRDPDDWKPMTSIGSGVREIRVRDESGAFRVIYVASFADSVYVLHAFQKKSRRTSPTDVALAEARFRALKRSVAR